MEMCNEISAVFHACKHNIHSAVYRPREISAFRSYYLRNIFRKAIVVTDNDSFDGYRQHK